MGSSIKLNLGSGKKKLSGYINCDLPDNAYNSKPDVFCDVRILPFKDGSADEILAVHVWEHFYLNSVDEIIAEWKRVLKSGGKLILEMPCLDKVVGWLRDNEIKIQMTMWALYGDPSTHKSEADLHKWCWSINMIKSFLKEAGFINIKYLKPLFHVEHRDMRIEAVKA